MKKGHNTFPNNGNFLNFNLFANLSTDHIRHFKVLSIYESFTNNGKRKKIVKIVVQEEQLLSFDRIVPETPYESYASVINEMHS